MDVVEELEFDGKDGVVAVDLLLKKRMEDGRVERDRKEGIGFWYPNDKRLFKVVDQDRHYFRKFKGYAISKKLLDWVSKRGCRIVAIKEMKDGDWNRTLISDYSDWVDSGQDYHKEGFEEQRVLAEEYMKVNKPRKEDGTRQEVLS